MSVFPFIIKYAQKNKNIKNWMLNEIRLDNAVEMGITNRGKYTFPSIPLFPINVLEVEDTVEEK